MKVVCRVLLHEFLEGFVWSTRMDLGAIAFCLRPGLVLCNYVF